MSINIPQNIFDTYNQYADYLLENDNFSRVCTLYFPPIKESCASCVSLAGTSANVYQHGGPGGFSFNSSCEMCGGNGFREKEVTDTMRLRIYWRQRDWIKQGNITIANVACMIIGKISDLPKLMQCKEIELVSEETTLLNRYILAGQPFYHGFGKTRYFIAYLKS